MEKRNKSRQLFIYIVIMVIFENVVKDFFFFLPATINYLIRDIFSGICLMLAVNLFAFKKLRFNNKTSNNLYLFIVFQCFFIPVYSGILAYLNYGQPIYYGILAERGRLVSISVLIVYYYLLNNKVTLRDFHIVILKVAWFCLFFYLFVRLLFVFFPSFFLSDELAISKGLTIMDPRASGTKGGVVMRVGLSLLVYSIIFYFIEYIEKRKIKSLLKTLAFLSFIIFFNKGRGVFAFTIMSLAIYYWFNSNLKGRLVLVFSSVGLIIILFFSITQINKDNQSSSFFSSYTNIIAGISEVSKGHTSLEDIESSTWARVYSLGIVGDEFARNSLSFLFGKGTLSNQYNDGFQGQISKYFYPVDIGVAGALFLYGIFIVIFFKLIFLQIYRKLKAPSTGIIYVKAMRYFMLYFFIAAIQTGSDILGVPEVLVLFFCFSSFCDLKSRGKPTMGIYTKKILVK